MHNEELQERPPGGRGGGERGEGGEVYDQEGAEALRVVGGREEAEEQGEEHGRDDDGAVLGDGERGDGRPGSSGLERGREAEGLSHDVAAGAQGVVDLDARRYEPEAVQEEEEQGRAPRMMRSPPVVSQQAREQHELTHTPFRAWCKHCVRARGRNSQHQRQGKGSREGQVPRVSFDYFFLSEQDERASSNPILVMVDEETGDKFARATGKKGLGDNGELDWLISDIVHELHSWGHCGGDGSQLIMKSDGEMAIKVVRDAVARRLGGRVVLEQPPKGESQSNGVVEEAGKTIREFARLFKDQLEDKTGVKIETGAVIVQWLIRWSAMCISRFMIGKDGKTAFERRRGRACQIPVACFGEVVHYKELQKKEKHRNKFECPWREGVWLGHATGANEVLIGTKLGVVRAYAFRRKPADQRWNRGRGTTDDGNPSAT